MIQRIQYIEKMSTLGITVWVTVLAPQKSLLIGVVVLHVTRNHVLQFGNIFSISGTNVFKAAYSDGRIQSPFLVGTASESGAQNCRMSTQGLFFLTFTNTLAPR